MKKTLALGLGGGGARGLAHIGVLEVLDENGIKPDMIAGTSMGAIVGGLYALGYSAVEMKKMVENLNIPSIRPVRYLNLLHESLLRDDMINDVLDQLFENKTFEDCKIPFCTIAVDLETGHEVLFEKGSLKDAIRATVSVPILFPPHFYNDRYLIDGGLINNVPLSCLRDKNPDVLIGVRILNYTSRQYISGMVYRKYHRKKYAKYFKKRSFLSRFFRSRNRDLHLLLGIALRAMDIAAHDSTKVRIWDANPDLLLKPNIVCGMLEFDQAGVAMEEGKAVMEKDIDKLKKLLS